MRLTSRRKAVSVMPAIGAKATGSVSWMDPMRVMPASLVPNQRSDLPLAVAFARAARSVSYICL